MIKKLVMIALLVGVSLSAGLIEDGIAEARKGNNTQALKIFEKSCSDTNTAKGCFFSGQAYSHGTIVTKDTQKGFDFFIKSCDLGYTEGCMVVASAYFYGQNVDKDYVKAEESFIKACNQGEPNGCFLLASMYDLGKGVKRNKSEAKKRYSEACEYGSKMGCKYKNELTHDGIK
ncbi:MAG: tetratricopeptide repeat protein [Sulfurimonas sp.]